MNVQPGDTTDSHLHFIRTVPEGLIITYMCNQSMWLRLVSSSARDLVRTTKIEDEEQKEEDKRARSLARRDNISPGNMSACTYFTGYK